MLYFFFPSRHLPFFYSQTNFTITLSLRVPSVKLLNFLSKQLRLELHSVFGKKTVFGIKNIFVKIFPFYSTFCNISSSFPQILFPLFPSFFPFPSFSPFPFFSAPFLHLPFFFPFTLKTNLKWNPESCFGLSAHFLLVYSAVHRRTRRCKLSVNSCFFSDLVCFFFFKMKE